MWIFCTVNLARQYYIQLLLTFMLLCLQNNNKINYELRIVYTETQGQLISYTALTKIFIGSMKLGRGMFASSLKLHIFKTRL